MSTGNSRPLARRAGTIGLAAGVAAIIATAAVAQPPTGRPGAPMQPGGAGRGQGRGGGFGGFGALRRMGGNATAATTPIPALAAELNLNAKQQADIKGVQDRFRSDLQALIPAGMRPGGGGPGGPGRGPNAGGPGRGPNAGGPGGGMRPAFDPALMKKFEAAAVKANAGIEKVLTPAQKKALPAAVKEISTLRQIGIPPDTLGSLKLTAGQKSRIGSVIATSQKQMDAKMKAANGDYQSLAGAFQETRQKTHDAVFAALTAPQKAIIDKYEKEHPRGGRGGFGGPGGGGPGGGGRRGPGGGAGRPGGV
ncbi:MAG TPA: hypothetical protein VKT77_18520 [Chthonomonadaceae bacterium]|nr:hypothetical protein [Chthonomonadaceae bacterium]